MKINTKSITNKFVLSLLLLGLTLPLAAASCDKESKNGVDPKADSPKTKTDDTKQGASKTPPPVKKDTKKAKAPGIDTYPDLPIFAKLTPDQRTQFKAIAEADLCPCPDSKVSLHVCMKKKELRCGLAQRASMVVMRGVVQGVKQDDILAQVAKFVTASKKQHKFTTKNVPYLGNPKASIEMVEFADFQCPHCRMASGIMKKVVEKHKNDVVFYYKHYPLPSHTQASVAAAASLAAHEQGKFWPMHDLIFANQTKLSDDSYEGFAKQIGLNVKKFNVAMKSPAIVGAVMNDKAEGNKAELTGTPTLYINGRQYFGEKTVEALSAVVEEMKKNKGK